MSDDTRFVRPPQGRFAIGCAALFIGLPAVGLALGLGMTDPRLAAIPLAVGLGIVAIAYLVFNEEVSATLDARGLRLARARVLFGWRMAERVDWEISAEALTEAREIQTKRPAKNGGWSTSTELRLPEGRTLDAALLGGAEDGRGPYRQLVKALRERLGAAFRREERTG